MSGFPGNRNKTPAQTTGYPQQNVQVIMVPMGQQPPMGTQVQYIQQPMQIQQNMNTTNIPQDGMVTSQTGGTTNGMNNNNVMSAVNIPPHIIKRNKMWARGTILRDHAWFKLLLFFVFFHHWVWLIHGLEMTKEFVAYACTVILPAITISFGVIYEGWSYGPGGFKKSIESKLFPIVIPIGYALGIILRIAFWFVEMKDFCPDGHCRLHTYGYLVNEVLILGALLVDSILLFYFYQIRGIFGNYSIRLITLASIITITSLINIIFFSSENDCLFHFPGIDERNGLEELIDTDLPDANKIEHCNNFRNAYIIILVWMCSCIIEHIVLKFINIEVVRKTVFIINCCIFGVWTYFMFVVDIAGQWWGIAHWWWTVVTNLYLYSQVIALLFCMKHSHWNGATEQVWEDDL